jgi:hypothetical protein
MAGVGQWEKEGIAFDFHYLSIRNLPEMHQRLYGYCSPALLYVTNCRQDYLI